MNGAVNGFSINGTALPSWVVRAVVVAAAAATVASSEPTRTTYATAHGDAAVASVAQALAVRMAMAQQDSATAGATLAEGIVFGMQHWGAADGMLAIGADQRAKADASYAARSGASLAMAVTLDSTATSIQQAHVADVLATALVGRAYALANSEIRAPDDRYMIVGQEDRAMVVSTEERLMVVTA